MNTQTLQKSKKRPRIWAIGGGKGGVGKSVVSILLALELARNGQKTVLVDVDFGGANLHTLMGIKSPARTLNDFVTRKYTAIEEICLRTQVSNLELVCGASEILTLANPQFMQKHKIVQSVIHMSADQVILDLGAGTSYNVLDFFLVANNPIVVLTPQPISIQNAYAFVRNTIYRKLSRMANQQSSLQEVIRTAMDPKNDKKMRTIIDLIDMVGKSHGAETASLIGEAASQIRPMIITNMARGERDENAGRIIELVAEKYLTVRSRQLGAIAHDPLIEKMISQMMPIAELPKKSRASIGAQAIVQMILN